MSVTLPKKENKILEKKASEWSLNKQEALLKIIREID